MNIFIITIMGILYCSVVYLLIIIYLGQSSIKWTCTTGKLIEFKIINARFVSAHVKYEYVVNGNKYIGSRISFMNPVYQTIKDLESDVLCNKIKQDSFNVYYFDKYPKISTLKTGFTGWFVTILLIIMFLFGLFWLATYLNPWPLIQR